MAGPDHRELQRVIAGAQPPGGLQREDRVRWIGEAAEALLAGRLPGPAARMFVGGALAAWLRQGGSLERDYFRVTQRGSHLTPQRLWESLIGDERQAASAAIPSGSPSTSDED